MVYRTTAPIDQLRRDKHARRRQHQVPQISPPRILIPDRQWPIVEIRQDRRHAITKADHQTDDARLPVYPSKYPHQDHRHQRHRDRSCQPQIKKQHALLTQKGHIDKTKGQNKRHRNPPNLGIVLVGLVAHDKTRIYIAHKERRKADAYRVKGRISCRHQTRHHKPHQPGG